ncbi:hypothetical protein ACI2KC_10085 [Pseudomonas monteilii]
METRSNLIKKCIVCECTFKATRSTAKYCGQVCKDSKTNSNRAARRAVSPHPRRERGRAPRIKINTIAPLLRCVEKSVDFEFSIDTESGKQVRKRSELNLHWFDDYIMGACYVSMREDHGRLDVSPTDIRRICKLDTISAKGVKSLIWNHEIRFVSQRHAQRLANVAMFAIEGIEIFLDRNPSIKSKLTVLANAQATEAERESAKIEREFLADWDRIKSNA